MSVPSKWLVSNNRIRFNDGSFQWFSTQEERDQVWEALLEAEAKATKEAEINNAIALFNELRERAAMYGMEP